MVHINCGICKVRCKGNVLKVGDQYVHRACFKCQQCNCRLESGKIFQKGGKYYCSNDYNKLFAPHCAICRQSCQGEVVYLLNRTFHAECCKCQHCGKLFKFGDRATLWDNEYLCDHCRKFKELTTSTFKSDSNDIHANLKSSSEEVEKISRTGEPLKSNYNTEKDMSLEQNGTEGNVHITTPQSHRLPLAWDGYSSELNLESPRTISGHESKRSPEFGRFYVQSYLRLQDEQRSLSASPRNYSRVQSDSTSKSQSSLRSQHFHIPPYGQFSYRKPANRFDVKKMGMDSLYGRTIGTHQRRQDIDTPDRCASENQMNSSLDTLLPNHSTDNYIGHPAAESDCPESVEPRRLACFPGAREPDTHVPPVIERLDFPAPPSAAVILNEKRREWYLKSQEQQSRSVDICDSAVNLPGVDNAETRPSKYEKVSRALTDTLTSRKSGLAEAFLREIRKEDEKSEADLDPVSASRSPAAFLEPSYKTRYQQHTLASPSRDSRRDRRHAHPLASPMGYSITGGRWSTSISCPNTPRNIHAINGGATSVPVPSCLLLASTPRNIDSDTQNQSMHLNMSGIMDNSRLTMISNADQATTAVASERASSVYFPLVSYSGHESHDLLVSPQTLAASRGLRHIYPYEPLWNLPYSGQPLGLSSSVCATSLVSRDEMTDRPESTIARSVILHGGMNAASLSTISTMGLTGGGGGGGIVANLPCSPNVQSWLKSTSRSSPIQALINPPETLKAKQYAYEMLKLSKNQLPKGVDKDRLENYLSDVEFESIFHMKIKEFHQLPLWKQNDLKKRMDLFP